MRLAVRKLQIEDAAKLQTLVVENFDAIEPGLTVLDARLLLGHATIDVVAIDAAGTLVLCAVGLTRERGDAPQGRRGVLVVPRVS